MLAAGVWLSTALQAAVDLIAKINRAYGNSQMVHKQMGSAAFTI
jgi:hypothetical protein